MKVYTVSDIHIDYKKNRLWLHKLSKNEFIDDILILAGDISGNIRLIIETFEALKKRFAEVLYIPGNHDLWVQKDSGTNSLGNFSLIKKIAQDYNVRMEPAHFGPLSIVPMFGWYDYSFGEPSDQLLRSWTDFSACKWPDDYEEDKITNYFTSINEEFLSIKNEFVISFSHFMPRIDLMPFYIPPDRQLLYPVLGSIKIEQQIRKLVPDIHIYGHSHLNMDTTKEEVKYINNAFGYPHETSITAKQLLCIFES